MVDFFAAGGLSGIPNRILSAFVRGSWSASCPNPLIFLDLDRDSVPWVDPRLLPLDGSTLARRARRSGSVTCSMEVGSGPGDRRRGVGEGPIEAAETRVKRDKRVTKSRVREEKVCMTDCAMGSRLQ